ncbi:MAG: sodium/proton-translocating pyrophosphatase, partial [Candidatus ainarchaeum sp.]|nr:sodium/proton-translocating pyrophosphatase [Candidatus ainarchaeum sp.]
MNNIVLFTFFSGIFVLLYGLFLAFKIKKAPAGTQKMNEISKAIEQGANAFLTRQYITILPITIILAAIIFFTIGMDTSISFVAGVLCSALAGFIGMK